MTSAYVDAKLAQPEMLTNTSTHLRLMSYNTQGGGCWRQDEVVALNYREDEWPEDIVPYQIQLDDGRLLFARLDDERYVREAF